MSRRLALLLLATLLVGGTLVGLCIFPLPPTPQPRPAVAEAEADNRVQLSVTEFGFEPAAVRVRAGKAVTLVVTRRTDNTCATELVVPDAGIRVPLPLHVPVSINFVPSQAGRLRYGCGMQMMVGGVLFVE